MPRELTTADIQGALFEYRAQFVEPIFSVWYERIGQMVNAVHKALAPWQIELQNVSWNREAKSLQEAQFTFGVPTLWAGITVGLGGVTMNSLNPAWSNAQPLLSLFETALLAVKASTSAEIQNQQTSMTFHVKPGTRPFREIMRQFVNAQMLGGEDATMYGVSVYKPDYTYVIDGSAVHPDGIFVKMVRLFPSTTGFEEMATIIYKDEEQLLSKLGMKLK